MPPDGSLNYRGVSTQKSTPPMATQPEAHLAPPSFTNVSVTRTSNAAADRAPRPVDDTGVEGNASGRKPIISTIQPRAKDDASDRSVDIVDLPKNPASGP